MTDLLFTKTPSPSHISSESAREYQRLLKYLWNTVNDSRLSKNEIIHSTFAYDCLKTSLDLYGEVITVRLLRPITFSFFRWSLLRVWGQLEFYARCFVTAIWYVWQKACIGIYARLIFPVIPKKSVRFLLRSQEYGQFSQKQTNDASVAEDGALSFIRLCMAKGEFSGLQAPTEKRLCHCKELSQMLSSHLQRQFELKSLEPRNTFALAIAFLKVAVYSKELELDFAGLCDSRHSSSLELVLAIGSSLPWPADYNIWVRLSDTQPQKFLHLIACKESAVRRVALVANSAKSKLGRATAAKLCSLVTTQIAGLLPLSTREGVSNPLVCFANKLKRQMKGKPPFQSMPEYAKLNLHISSARLGLSVACLEQSRDFCTFAQTHFIHRYLYVYGHCLRETSTGLEIMFDGEYTPWSVARGLMRWAQAPRDGGGFEGKTAPQFLGKYCSRGLVNEGVCDWEALRPFIRVLPPTPALVLRPKDSTLKTDYQLSPIHTHDWGARYLLEVCLWIVDEPRLSGDHAWLRLKGPDGAIYSVGQYRPGKNSLRDHLWLPMQIKTSQFQSPDISEFWNGPYTSIEIEISEEHFELAKKRIELDQRAQMHVYQLFHGNCVNYAQSVAEMVGIKLPSELPIFNLLVRRPIVYSTAELFRRVVPQRILAFVSVCWTVYFNLLSYLLGAGYVDAAITYQHPFVVRPYIRSWRDILDPSKAVINHPFILGEYVKDEVAAWREQQAVDLLQRRRELQSQLRCVDANEEKEALHHLTECDEQIEGLKYAVPPQFRCTPATPDSLSTNLTFNLKRMWSDGQSTANLRVNPEYMEKLKALYAHR